MIYKKIMALMIVGASTFSLSACGSSNKSSEVNNKNIKASSDAKSSSKDEDKIIIDINDTDEQVKAAKITNDEAFEIASKTVKDYFNFDADKSLFTAEDIIDMNTYWIVHVSSDTGDFEVRIFLEDKKPFFMSGSASAAHKLKEEYMKNKGIEKIHEGDEEFVNYYYSKKPASEEESRKIAEEFIKISPVKDIKLKFLESSFEYKYDSQEKEYYVFTYVKEGKDPKNPQNLVIIKVNNYLREVSEVSI